MKKSVVILIGIIYIASIFVVGFFGMQIKAFDTIIYITDIECTNEEVVTKPDKTKEIEFDYDASKDDMENSIIITYEVFPKNSTLKGTDAVRLTYDPSHKLITKGLWVVDGLTITFKSRGELTFYLKSLDGSNIIETINIVAI